MVIMKNIKKVYILELIVEGKNAEEVNFILERITNFLKPLCKSISYKNILQGEVSDTSSDKFKYHCEISCTMEVKKLNEDIEDSNFKELLEQV